MFYRTPDKMKDKQMQALCRVYERAIKRQFDKTAIVEWGNNETIRVKFRKMIFIHQAGSDDDNMYFFELADQRRLVTAALSFDEQNEVEKILDESN